MKKFCYILSVVMYTLFVWPLIFIKKDKWNEIGRKIDYYFDIKSKHTKNYEKEKR